MDWKDDGKGGGGKSEGLKGSVEGEGKRRGRDRGEGERERWISETKEMVFWEGK